MSARALRRLLANYAIVLAILFVIVRVTFSLSMAPQKQIVVSRWRNGERIERTVRNDENPPTAATSNVSVGEEEIVGESTILMNPLIFPLALVPGRDGVKATLGDKVAYATVDDLVSRQAYDKSFVQADSGFGWGTYRPIVIAVLAEQLGVTAPELEERATFKRVRFQRRNLNVQNTPSVPSTPDVTGASQPRPEHITEKDLTRELVTDSLREAAQHLARNLEADGRFRYLIDASTNRRLSGYNWPRHSGATFFLAQAASILNDPSLRAAALRAGGRLRDQMTRDCGANRCIGEDNEVVEIGSTALALIAFTEIVRTNADTSYRSSIAGLAGFLRSQQRPDGEFMHQYNRAQKQPIDVQFLYFSGEATLALARAHEITKDANDLEAAKKGLAHISGSGWNFFGSRYYYSEEHWTCQAVAELWSRSPDYAALDFCSRWHEYQRRLQIDEGGTPFDADGSFGVGPLVVPRVTPAASRGEAAGALLDVLVREQHANHLGREDERPLVQHELDRSLAFVLRNQFSPGPSYLFADPVAVRGALPGSPVDWVLRIDYAQHAGCMMARWLEVNELESHH